MESPEALRLKYEGLMRHRAGEPEQAPQEI
jgi:hypothetical protein